jgi:ATP-binding cassette subfamily C protein CydCD
VTFDHCTVRYPGGRGPALTDFSLRLQPGQVVALTGPSGSGKSTVLHALLGFAPLSTGSIEVAGRTLSEVDLDEWRSHVAWVPQRPYLFAGGVIDNIRLGRPEATEAQVRRAAIRAQAGDLLSTVVGEDGHGLSDGQRQRIALARAFLRDAPVLLLDEPTANLDPATEAAVVASIGELAANRTVLMVAHRPALLAIADRSIVLTPGRQDTSQDTEQDATSRAAA